MQNDHIDLQTLKITEHFNPLFQVCYKAIPSQADHLYSPSPDISHQTKTYSYVLINGEANIPQKIFECKSICPIFNSNSKSYILVKGQNLWDFYRARKQKQIVLTQEEIWILLKDVVEGLLHLSKFGIVHTHLKEYAIYRQSEYSFQVMYHPSQKSMAELAQSDQFYWYDFYLSPQQLKTNSHQTYIHTHKDTVFSLGLLILNVMNVQDFNKDIYFRTKFQVDWQAVGFKINNCQNKYSSQLISLVKNCLMQASSQRYGLKQIQTQISNHLNQNKSLNLQFKLTINQMITSKLKSSLLKSKSPSPKSVSSPQKKSASSPSKSKSKLSLSITKKQISSDAKIKKEDSSNQNKNKDEKIKDENLRHTIQNSNRKNNLHNSLPKKWKDSALSPKNSYSIAQSNIVPNQLQHEGEGDRQMDEKFQKIKGYEQLNAKHKQDVINFERGTFGGQQTPIFSSLQIKQKNPIRIQTGPQNEFESNQNPNKQEAWPNQLSQRSKQEELQRINLSTFGQKNLQPFNNQNNEASNPAVQNIGSQENDQKQSHIYHLQEFQLLGASKDQIEATEKVNANYQRSFNIADLKLRSKDFESALNQIEKIREFITGKQREITLDRRDCHQPIQTLKKSVSQNPGIYIQGNLYFGNFKNGRRNGFGLQIFPENEYFFGNFKDDLFHGEGFYFWNKNQHFLGLFENGTKIFGNLIGPKLNYWGQFKNHKKMNGMGRSTAKTGQIYTGYWKQGKKHGLGELIQITDDKFIGNWEKGKKLGYGEHFSCGFPYEGCKLKAIWKKDEIVSDAIIQYSNGNVYEGALNDDFQKHGKGLFEFKKGGYFKGTFYKDNATHGQLVYKNEEKYIGSLRNMKRHGFGEYHYLDGIVKKGNWIEDVRVEKQ